MSLHCNVIRCFIGLEIFPFSVTFFCCLFINMEYGILIGAGVHLLLLAYSGNRPHPELTRLPANHSFKV